MSAVGDAAKASEGRSVQTEGPVHYEEVQGGVAVVTLARPERMNSLDEDVEKALHAALDRADAAPSVRAIVLTGRGKAFCAGFDMGGGEADDDGADRPINQGDASTGDYLAYWQQRDRDTIRQLMHLWELRKPVIAAVDGWALGAGFWYSLAADITIASEDAVFGQPEVRHVSNTTFLFAALVGWKAANRYSLTGDHFDAAEALRIGVVNEVVGPGEALTASVDLARRIAKVPQAAVRLNKAIAMSGSRTAGVDAGLMLNETLSTIVHCSDGPERAALQQVQRQDGLRAYLDARDGPFRPEPFGPRARPASS